MNSLCLNPSCMTFRIPHVLGGILLAGRKGEGAQSGNGDCVLLDGGSGLAGIADGADRSPRASRAFLSGLAERMSTVPPGEGDEPLRRLVEAGQAVLETFRYEDRSTFVCVIFPGDGSLCYVCGGDSLLFRLDSREGRIRFRNRANMGFTGRSTQILDSGRMELNRGDLILLATDGVWDLTAGDSEALTAAFFDALRTGPLHDAPVRIARERHVAFRGGGGQPHDDFCALLLDPFRMTRFPGCMIAGGTGRIAEARYREERLRRQWPDRYFPVTVKEEGLWTFPEDLSLLIEKGERR